MDSDFNKNIAKTWDDFWDEKDNKNSVDSKKGKKTPLIHYFQNLERNYNLDRWYKEALLKEITNGDSLKIIEAGSGEGETALNIYQKEHSFFLLDISEKAIEITKRRFCKSDFSGNFIRGSIFEFPFKKNSFDVVLSIGIFEHFQKDQHNQLYNEHLRITKKRGKLIILVPNKRAYFYRLGKWYAQKNNLWKFGYEEPFISLKPLYRENSNAIHIKEYSGGFLTQFYFTMFLFKKVKFLKMAYLGIVSIVNRIFWFVNHLDFYGFYLVNVTEKV